MIIRLATIVLALLSIIACGNDILHSSPSFMSFEHQDGDRYEYVNMLIKHVHDETWHIPYATDVADKNFEAAIKSALQMWLQPLRNMQPSKSIVNNFVFYRYSVGDPYGSGIPWDDVLFKIHFRLGGSQKGSYGVLYYPKGIDQPSLAAHDVPDIAIYKIDRAADDFVTDSDFMLTLVHELGHGLWLGRYLYI